MQPTTTGMAAILAQVRIFGRESELLAHPLVVAMFIRPTNTARASVPVLTFVSCCGGFVYECQNQRDTSKYKYLKRDEIWSNRHRALILCLSMIFSENRFTLFRIML